MSKTASILGSLLFFVVAPGTVAGWIPFAISRWRLRPPLLGAGVVRTIGAGLLVAGVGCLVECFARFALKGRGTPAPVGPTEQLVVSGLYRHVRNPMYLAVVATIVGQGLLLGNVTLLEYAAVVWLAFHLFVLAYEEPTLERQFGEAYGVYRAHVGRWWPRATPFDASVDEAAGAHASRGGGS